MRRKIAVSAGLALVLLAAWIGWPRSSPVAEAPAVTALPAARPPEWATRDPGTRPASRETAFARPETGIPEVDASAKVFAAMRGSQDDMTAYALHSTASFSKTGVNAPERRYAAGAVGPWSRIQAGLQASASGDPDAEALLADVDGAVADLRSTMQEDYGVDRFEERAQRQRAVLAEVGASPYADADTRAMVALLEHRLDRYDQEAAEPGPTGL